MNKTTKILLALGAVALVVGLTVVLSSNRQPSESQNQGSVRNIVDENVNGIKNGDANEKWEKLTLGGGQQNDWFQRPDKELLITDVIVAVRHDPNSATTSSDALVEPSSSFYVDVSTSTASTPINVLNIDGGLFASGTLDTAPYGSIVDRFYLASTTGSGVNSALALDYNQMYAELVGSTTVKTAGWAFRGDESDLLGLPITVATSSPYVVATLFEDGGDYNGLNKFCTPGADDPGYGCQPATSTVIGFLVDVWIKYIAK